MIITRIETEDSIKVIYESSTILTSNYKKDGSKLVITFKNGGQYSYESVKLIDYLRLETAESVGKVFNQYIKPYPMTKLGVIDTGLIFEEIEEVKKTAVESISELLFKEMMANIETHNELKIFNKYDIKRLKEVIEKWVEISGN